MIIKKQKHDVHVYHENNHQIGTFTWDTIWSKWILKTEHAGLDTDDLYKLYKLSKRLD